MSHDTQNHDHENNDFPSEGGGLVDVTMYEGASGAVAFIIFLVVMSILLGIIILG